MMFNVAPLAQTPWDKKHAQAQKKHSDSIHKTIESMIPWASEKRPRSKLAHLRGKVKPGEVVVVLDAGDRADLELYQDAKILRE